MSALFILGLLGSCTEQNANTPPSNFEIEDNQAVLPSVPTTLTRLCRSL